jgi:hypothetical protein
LGLLLQYRVANLLDGCCVPTDILPAWRRLKTSHSRIIAWNYFLFLVTNLLWTFGLLAFNERSTLFFFLFFFGFSALFGHIKQASFYMKNNSPNVRGVGTFASTGLNLGQLSPYKFKHLYAHFFEIWHLKFIPCNVGALRDRLYTEMLDCTLNCRRLKESTVHCNVEMYTVMSPP